MGRSTLRRLAARGVKQGSDNGCIMLVRHASKHVFFYCMHTGSIPVQYEIYRYVLCRITGSGYYRYRLDWSRSFISSKGTGMHVGHLFHSPGPGRGQRRHTSELVSLLLLVASAFMLAWGLPSNSSKKRASMLKKGNATRPVRCQLLCLSVCLAPARAFHPLPPFRIYLRLSETIISTAAWFARPKKQRERAKKVTSI